MYRHIFPNGQLEDLSKLLDNADVVADRFHVMKQVNSELDGRRKALRREARSRKELKQERADVRRTQKK